MKTYPYKGRLIVPVTVKGGKVRYRILHSLRFGQYTGNKTWETIKSAKEAIANYIKKENERSEGK